VISLRFIDRGLRAERVGRANGLAIQRRAAAYLFSTENRLESQDEWPCVTILKNAKLISSRS
jgi:hypothetical protein